MRQAPQVEWHVGLAPRHRRRADGGCRRPAQGDGPCDGGRAAVGLYTAFVPILIYALLLTAALRRMPEVSCWALAGSLPSQVAGVWSGMGAWGKVMAAEIQLRDYPPAPAASPLAVRRVVAAVC